MAKRRWGDRRDGRLIREIDGMHYVMPLMYPNRCDNEAYMTLNIDLEKTEKYIKVRNQENPELKMSLFGLIIAAVLKTIKLRPQMNRFIANKNIYQRNEIAAAFTVKKEFTDEGEETLARVPFDDKDNIDDIVKIHNKYS